MYRKVLLLCLVAFVASCSQWRMKNEIESFSKESICLPADLEIVQDGVVLPDSLSQTLTDPIKLILYFAADRCTSCVIGRLHDYEKIFRLRMENQFSPTIIFSPKDEPREYKALIADLKFQSLPYPIYIDKHSEFQQLNPKFPEDTRYHTFLLDKNNRVVLVGNPLASDAMWSLFKSTLDNMLAHGGVYVPEK